MKSRRQKKKTLIQLTLLFNYVIQHSFLPFHTVTIGFTIILRLVHLMDVRMFSED